jgi:hypothetical protein
MHADTRRKSKKFLRQQSAFSAFICVDLRFPLVLLDSDVAAK